MLSLRYLLYSSYEETILRMVRLMYVRHLKRWFNRSLRDLTGDWLRHVEGRFASAFGGVEDFILPNLIELARLHIS
jgi:enoyl reductase-like protein